MIEMAGRASPPSALADKANDADGSSDQRESDLLRVHDLTTVMGSGQGVVVVNGVSFSVQRGRALGIVGESGSGKSLACLSVLGLVPFPGRIAAGTAHFDGVDLLSMRQRELNRIRGNRIGYVLQDPMASLNPTRRIGAHVGESLRIHEQLSAKQARRRVIDLLGLVGIPDPASRVDDYPHQFSGGMRQRVLIAAAIACGPDLLIADEPTTSLDVTIQAQILRLLSRLQRELSMSLILVSHDLRVVESACDEVAVMYAGRVVEEVQCEDLFSSSSHPYTQGLIGSLPPRGGRRLREKLKPIVGTPPDPNALPPGCAFSPRCQQEQEERCRTEVPPLLPVAGSRQRAACWITAGQAGGGQREQA